MRDKILYIVVLILIAIAAFQGGYIVGHHERDETKAEVQKLNSWVLDHGGRIEALETMDKRERTGSGRPVVKR